MAIGRVARRDRANTRRKRTYVIPVAAFVVLAIAAIGSGVALGVFRAAPADVESVDVAVPMAATDASLEASLAASQDASGTDTMVEVPDVTGKQLEEADMLLEVAGFTVTHVATPAGESATGTVLAQDPAHGAIMERGTTVTLTYADDGTGIDPTTRKNNPSLAGAGRIYVVCIDPGHQDKANNEGEPIGPGSTTLKPKVTGGASGAVTKQREPDFALKVAVRLKTLLEAEGVKVVMTRTTGAVDISNAQRAGVANAAKADLFIRIHADGSTNGDIRGLSSLYPAGNDWVKPISAESLKAARVVHKELLLTTGAVDRGIVERKDIAGFNWSKVPALIVECGFMSNPVEDKLLASEAYQAKLAEGMTAGIMTYLRGE
ncbi:MAG: PASTA domain-containing protein [Actinobacteria bacterium]|nr:MAG: PASTA domain-containing protein [Actinomycetota bacterium]